MAQTTETTPTPPQASDDTSREGVKTLVFCGISVAILLLAVFTRPTSPTISSADMVGQMLNEVDDPRSATQLEIVSYDEDLAQLSTFEVARENGTWTIPSADGYPADATEQMGEAAASVMNLSILGMVSDDASQHAEFGVVEPDPKSLKPGAKGVGTRVVMSNSKGDALVNMVIGKEVQEAEGQHYIREVGKDQVYIVKIDPTKLTTTFEDWIEEDLLSLNKSEIKGILLQDYSTDLELVQIGGRIGMLPIPDPRSIIDLVYNSEEQTWSVDRLLQFNRDQRKYDKIRVSENDELNEEKLNELVDALDDLKIVDVARKPEGLSANLKASRDFVTPEANESLQQKGFYFTPVSDTEIELVSSEGEITCRMDDGVEYLLRFGKPTNVGSTGQNQDGEHQGSNRWLFIQARVNEALIEKPELAPLPGKEKETNTEEQPETEEKNPADKADANDDAAGASSEGPSDSEESSDSDESSSEAESEGPDLGLPSLEEELEDEGDAEKTADGADQDASGDEKAAESDEPSEAADKSSTEESDAKDGQAEEDSAAQEAIREAVKRANDEKLAEYREKVAEAEARAAELNERFGDWYYVISDEVYQKIHLTADDIFTRKPEGEGNSVQDLRAIEQKGLETETEQPPNRVPGGLPFGNQQ